MMEARFETAFLKASKKHASIRKQVKNKVDMILENPVSMGEPLKGNWQGFYSCPVKRNFIIIYLFCKICRKKGDDAVVLCSDCGTTPDQTVKFVLLSPHDQAYGAH
jgi:addiction module RelE/StbE family toxin